MAEEKKKLTTNKEIDDAVLYFFKDFHDEIREKDLIGILKFEYHINDDTKIKRSLGRLWASGCLYRRETGLKELYYKRKIGIKSKREIEENKNKIFLFSLICGQNDYDFYFDPEDPFNYKGTLSTQASYTYSGTYHPESYTYTGISVGGVAVGEVKKNDAYVKSHQTYNGKGNLTYDGKVVDCVILDSKLVPFAVEAGILVSDQGIIKLRSDFTQSDLNTLMSNMGMGAYSQINLANLSSEKAPTMSNCSKIFQFLNKAMGGVFTPEAAEAIKNRKKKRKVISIYVALIVLAVVFLAFFINVILPMNISKDVEKRVLSMIELRDPSLLNVSEKEFEAVCKHEKYNRKWKTMLGTKMMSEAVANEFKRLEGDDEALLDFIIFLASIGFETVDDDNYQDLIFSDAFVSRMTSFIKSKATESDGNYIYKDCRFSALYSGNWFAAEAGGNSIMIVTEERYNEYNNICFVI